MNLAKNIHSTKEEIITKGSIFTPQNIVEIAFSWLKDLISPNDTIVDFGVGYGAFISRFQTLTNNLIGTDIDLESISFINKNFPNIKTFCENSLININREKYHLHSNDTIIIIGNPPYNDITSHYKKGEKGNPKIDDKVKARDLGISFMKMYSLLKPKYICILHPLSYLIKKTNFNSLKYFNKDYIITKGLIFSSSEFPSIKKGKTEFPVLLALYKREENINTNFSYIEDFTFNILNNKNSFKLNRFNFIDNWVRKYPNREKNNGDLLFYTLRDINALLRNKTFLDTFSNNGIKVTIENLYKYAWLDYFKNNFKPDELYLYGNLSPLYHKDLDNDILKKELISYIYNNNVIFNKYVNTNNLNNKVLSFYNMNNFNYNDNNIKTILESFYLF